MNEGMKAECQQKVQNFNHEHHLTSAGKGMPTSYGSSARSRSCRGQSFVDTTIAGPPLPTILKVCVVCVRVCVCSVCVCVVCVCV